MAVLYTEFYNNTGAGQGNIPVNQDIFHYIQQAPDGDFSKILAADNRWQVFYHLSSMRTSVLNWYEFQEGASLLEIGGEFGALTGLFCDRCQKVVTVEYGLYKAQAIQERYKNRDNLEIYAGVAEEMRFDASFDYIVMIGCMERQCGGSREPGVYVSYLNNIKRFLKPGGKILLAVENRYGLRYFCGEKEAYTKLPFGGINPYLGQGKGYTFGKEELKGILSVAGLNEQKFYYPLPDYKLTQMVYTDEYLPQKDLGERLLFYHTDSSTMVTAEQWLYRDIIDNGVFPFFANSFLVECSTEGEMGNTIFAAVTTDRGRKHGLATTIHHFPKEKGQKLVNKRALYAEGEGSIWKVYENMMALKERGVPIVPHEWKGGTISMPFVPGPTCSDYLRKLAAIGDREQFEFIFEQIYKNILLSSEAVSSEKNALLQYCQSDAERLPSIDFGIILKRCYIDMVPFNCFFIDGKLYYFDQEFVRENYPALYSMYRALMYTYAFTPEAEKLVPLEQMKLRYGLVSLWNIFREEEDRFVADNRQYDVYRGFYQWTGIDAERMQKNVRLLGKDIHDEPVKRQPCFSAGEQDLRTQIEQHEVISFLLEDTLLMYLVLNGQDAEFISYARGIRKEEMIIARKKMAELYQEALRWQKEIYLFTEMDIPRKQLEEVLEKHGITGYKNIYIAREHNSSAKRGLLKLIEEHVDGRKWLHVGTYGEDDIKADVFLIQSAYDMLKCSAYSKIIPELRTVNDRLLAGLFVSRIFNDPFILYQTDGRGKAKGSEELVYLFIAPIVSAFIVWLAGEIEKEDFEDVLFASRDGFFIQKMYRKYRSEMHKDIPEGTYFLTSRRAASNAGMLAEEDIRRIFSLPYEMNPREVLKDKFYLKDQEIPDDKENLTLMEYGIKYQKLICEKSAAQRAGYLAYIEKLGLQQGKTYGFFDLATSGTTQYYLNNFVPFHLKGFSLLWYDVGDEGKRTLDAKGMYNYKEGERKTEFEEYFRWNYAFLEPILTAPEPSVYSFDEEGVPQFGAEERTEEEIHFYKEAQDTIESFFDIYLKLHIPGIDLSRDVAGLLYMFKDSAYTDLSWDMADHYVSRDDLGAGIFRINTP